MADTRLVCEFPAILQPMIEPAQQDGIGVDQRLRTQINVPGAIAPGNVLPRTSHQILMPARKVAARLVAKTEESLNAARQIRVVPSGHMQRGNLNGAEPLRDV